LNQVGLVAIGRNEGQRLRQCLLSALGKADLIVYVDSGSTDGSAELAGSLGIPVVNLDLSIPFTAARARNAGFEHLLAVAPAIEFVQFVDGDCEIVPSWLDLAQTELSTNGRAAIVCGRVRERFPELSVYNQLCDMEWDTPIGEVRECGGIAMMRVQAFQQVGGFNPTLIAGEEPELCVRLRQTGWQIWRLDAEMTLHDAQMTHLSQWWKRTVRSGYAYAEGAWLHGQTPDRHWLRETQSIGFWGLGLPLAAFGMVGITQGLSLGLLIGYPVLTVRIFMHQRQKNVCSKHAMLYACFCVLGKFAQVGGALRFLRSLLLGTSTRLIEYRHD
jgi:glycosyltransferase involved in cell wall biosynthesis